VKTANSAKRLLVLAKPILLRLAFFQLLVLVVLGWSSRCKANDIYIAQTAQGNGTGTDCADAYSSTFFNTSGNWGSGASQIGPGTTVHICGTFNGGSAANLLTIQGSGTSGSPVALLFEAGAVVQAMYCASAGCINLNGKSYITIDGGIACGETSKWTVTPCNGTIQNTGVGSTGLTCIAGPCSTISGSVQSVGIGSGSGSPSHIEVRNLHLTLYKRNASDLSDSGMQTYGIGFFGGSMVQGLVVHNMIFNGMAKSVLASLGSGSGTLTDYEVYNSSFSDQCWAMGVGTDAPSMNVTKLLFHDNEVSNWENWAPANTSGNVCHTNGTMWFNGDGSTVHAGTGFIGDTSSGIYDNYLHGDLTGSDAKSSPSGMLSCQDNCINVPVFNNIVVSTCTGTSPSRSCGGNIYFNGAGGGGQQVYNNTLVAPAGSCVVVTGSTAPVVVKNNIFVGCGDTIEIRPNCPSCVLADNNDGFNVPNSSWVVNNSAGSGQFISLSTWRSSYGQDAHSSIGNPNLDANYKLQSGSAAISLGANLTGMGIPALNRDLSGMARPSSGPWDAAAYQYSSSSSGNPPNSPTNLLATVE